MNKNPKSVPTQRNEPRFNVSNLSCPEISIATKVKMEIRTVTSEDILALVAANNYKVLFSLLIFPIRVPFSKALPPSIHTLSEGSLARAGSLWLNWAAAKRTMFPRAPQKITLKQIKANKSARITYGVSCATEGGKKRGGGGQKMRVDW